MTRAYPQHARLMLCPQCDWLMRLPDRAPGTSARCPRCHHQVASPAQRDTQKPMAWALAALVMLAAALAFNFLGFSTHGIRHDMHFADAASALVGYDYPALAVLLLATTVALPAVYLAALVYLCAGIRAGKTLPGAIATARRLRPLEAWMMSDVFIVGVLVALVKIVTLADIHLEASFVAFCLYSLMLIRALTLVDWTTLWEAIAGYGPATNAAAGANGRGQNLMACRACAMPFVIDPDCRCPRCGKRHVGERLDRLQLTAALLATSVVAYIPANVYPILSTTQLGQQQPQTIIAGVVHLVDAGSWPIALVIFSASIVVPISKIIALGWLCLCARRPRHGDPAARTRAYRVVEKIGRWSMIDVFVVAVLGALVDAGALIHITPGPGAIAFAAVVVLTMIAARTFDTRQLWPDFKTAQDSVHGRA